MNPQSRSLSLATIAATVLCAAASQSAEVVSASTGLQLVGTTVSPHVRSEALRWRRNADTNLAARLQLFLLYKSSAGAPALRFDANSQSIFRAAPRASFSRLATGPGTTRLPPGPASRSTCRPAR